MVKGNSLTQTEYLEETVLRAEARSFAGRRSCSHPWDGQVYLYKWLYRSEASVCCHCFCFSAFDIIKAVQLLLWQAIAFLFPRPSALFGGRVIPESPIISSGEKKHGQREAESEAT